MNTYMYDYWSLLDTNGYNPVWSNRFDFDISNPECALIKFVVQDLDVFGDPIDLAQAVIPVPCIKQGYRSVALRNQHSEELELSSLLVHVEIHKVGWLYTPPNLIGVYNVHVHD